MDQLPLYLDALYQFALRLTRDPIEARELTQQTCVEAIKNIKQLQRSDRIKAWLFTILKNLYLDSLRRQNRERNAVKSGDFEGIPAFNDRDAMSWAQRPNGRIFSEEVEVALDGLPDAMKTVVLLADVEGFRYGEIAEIMGCPVGTVRSRLARARAILARRLATYAREQGILRRR